MKKRMIKSKPENEHNKELLYEELTEGARFREQYRFLFAATIVATFYVAPSGNPLETFLKVVLGIAMLLAALYLIGTAASVKYKDTRMAYQVFYASKKLRIKLFDWAVDSFAAGFLLFLAIIAVGTMQKVLNVRFTDLQAYGLVAVWMLLLGGLIGLVGLWLKRVDANDSEDVNRLI